MSKPKNPRSRNQWQQAVDAAAAARRVADCKMYGLIEGGPTIDVKRCDDILDLGRHRGVFPSRPVDELALELIRQCNTKTDA